MRKNVVYSLLFVFCAVFTKVQSDHAHDGLDYWSDEFSDFYDYEQGNDSEGDKKIEVDIKKFKEENEAKLDAAKEELDDYQFEDNRFKSSEDDKTGTTVHETKVEDVSHPLPKEATTKESDSLEDIIQKLKEKDAKSTQSSYNEDYALLWGVDDPLPVPSPPKSEDTQKILEETKDILSQDHEDFDEEKELPADFDSSELKKIIEETTKLLGEGDSQFEESVPIEDIKEEKEKEVIGSDENTVDKVKDDLDDDLKRLFDTLNKLSEDVSDESTKEKSDDNKELNAEKNSKEEQKSEDEEKMLEDALTMDVKDYEDKYGKPFREGLVLSQRNEDSDYELINDSNLSDIFANAAKDFDNDSDDTIKSVEESVHDTKISSADTSSPANTKASTDVDVQVPVSIKSTDSDKITEKTTTDPQTATTLQAVTSKLEVKEEALEPITYRNDALVNEDFKEDKSEVEQFDTEDINGNKVVEETTIRQKNVDELTSSEYDDLMKQFVLFNSENFDVQSDDFAKHVAPVHITLDTKEPVVITSPNFPGVYPTGNIIDWILEGHGSGIELNITDFAVNGALGDYLLIIPGGVDDSTTDGLVFSYRLNSERRYRFFDVNRMFVRFETMPGWSFFNGFRLSVKLISPPTSNAVEDLPEVEAVIQPPSETLTLNLGGLSAAEFKGVKEEFRLLIADMAKEYIIENEIDQGLNTTFEVTQITRVAVCNIHWPEFENCAQVTFGVPLTYEDSSEHRLNKQDLEDMWNTYVEKERFAARLRSLGITEFAEPDDSSVLMVWLVIAGGVVISMGMLAFVLWKYSCFPDYTRMSSFSDTDSLRKEKRDLDLYPTPHQTLPPLYAENEYKWDDGKYDDATRVDMGGFANKSYARNMYDFDSDEDVPPARDRNGAISPRQFYSNV